MKLTENHLNRIKQRLVHVLEQKKETQDGSLKWNDPENFRQEMAWYDGRENELTWVLEYLESLNKEEKEDVVSA